MIESIKEYVTKNLENINSFSKENVEDLIEKYIFENNKFKYKDLKEKEELIKTALDEIVGFKQIQALIEDQEITEIMINDKEILYEKNSVIYKWDKVMSKEDSNALIEIICEKSSTTINQTTPIVDGVIGRGIRANIVLAPIAIDGNAITIRKFPDKAIGENELLKNGFLSKELLLLLKLLVKAKYNIFICGGTASGKTTLLNILGSFINSNERVITIEDSPELRIKGVKNIVRLVTRKNNTEGKGEIAIKKLIKTSLRMRPDRIIVGEVRASEAIDMLQAMNTGHEGSLSTGHSNSPKDMIARLETMVLQGENIPLEAIRKQISRAIDIFIYLERNKYGRRVKEVCEVIKVENKIVKLNTIYSDGIFINEIKNLEKIKRYQNEKN